MYLHMYTNELCAHYSFMWLRIVCIFMVIGTSMLVLFVEVYALLISCLLLWVVLLLYGWLPGGFCFSYVSYVYMPCAYISI